MKVIKMKDDVKLSDIKIYVCAPGLGKTYAEQINNKYMDVDRRRSKFKYGKDDTYTIEEHEKEKGIRKSEVNNKEKVLKYSLELINNNIKNNIISLIAPNEDLVEKINELKIPYLIIFNDYKINEIIRKRLINRGNTKEFVEEMCGNEIAKKYYEKDMLDQRPNYKIIFDKDEYISDIKIKE